MRPDRVAPLRPTRISPRLTQFRGRFADVKPENIFIKGSHVLLGDLGFCKGFGDGARLSSCVGTVQFMAPEIIQNCTGGDWSNRIPKDDRDPYSEHIDVWALGVLVYELLSRSLPFRGDDTQAVCDAILSSSLALPSGISDECADFLSHALSRDPAFRPPAIVLLHHPFITAHISPPSLSKLVRAATSGREAVPVMSNDSTAALPVSTSSLHVDSAWERPDGPLPMRRSEQYAAGMRGPSEGCQPTSQAPSQQVSGERYGSGTESRNRM